MMQHDVAVPPLVMFSVPPLLDYYFTTLLLLLHDYFTITLHSYSEQEPRVGADIALFTYITTTLLLRD